MADEFMGGAAGGMRPGTNPVAHVQLIVYNAHTAEWKNRKRNAGNTKFQGPVDHNHMMALAAEPMVYERTMKLTRYTGSLDRETTLRLFTCLNGYGRKGETKYDILKRLRWGGFKGYRTLEDERELDTQIDFPTYFGGLFSINNNGPDVIYHGDYLYWDIPEDEEEAQEIIQKYRIEGQLSGKRGDRRTVFIRPYNPRNQTMNKYQLRKVSDKSPGEYLKAAGNKTGHFDKTSSEVFESIKAFIGIGYLLSISDSEEIGSLNSVERATRTLTEAFDNASQETLKGFFSRAEASDRSSIGYHHMVQAVMRFAAPKEYNEFVNERDVGRAGQTVKALQKGTLATRDSAHPALLERLLKNVVDGENYVKGRIIAKAVTPAAPGQSLDIIAIP